MFALYESSVWTPEARDQSAGKPLHPQLTQNLTILAFLRLEMVYIKRVLQKGLVVLAALRIIHMGSTFS